MAQHRLEGPPPVTFLRAALLLAASLLATGGDLRSGLSAISAKKIQAHVEELSSDAYEGRSAATPGFLRAAAYIENHFRDAGLEPGGGSAAPVTAGGEAQPDPHPFFRMWTREGTVPDPSCRVELQTGADDLEFEAGVDFLPHRASAEGSVEGEAVFVGYAIEASKWGYNDFRGVRLEDSVAVAFWHEPRETKSGKAFDGTEWTRHASVYEKAKRVAAEGARALLLVQDPLHDPHDRAPDFQWPLLPGWNGGPRDKPCPIPVMWLSLDAGEKLTGLDLKGIHSSLDRNLRKSRSRVLEDRRISVRVKFRRQPIEVPNVVGRVKGTEPGLGAVVVGAHYDHAGMDDRGRIWNGADDNASGTSVLLTLAEAFAKAPPRRDVILIAFAAEEFGLWGSEAYAQDPLVPMDQTMFMMNIDMVGRGNGKELAVMGAWDSRELKALVKEGHKKSGARIKIDTTGGRQFWRRSDQYNFFRHGVPALFISEVGIEHEDYHQPTDTADKIDSRMSERAGRVAYAIAWLAADADDPLPRVPEEDR